MNTTPDPDEPATGRDPLERPLDELGNELRAAFSEPDDVARSGRLAAEVSPAPARRGRTPRRLALAVATILATVVALAAAAIVLTTRDDGPAPIESPTPTHAPSTDPTEQPTSPTPAPNGTATPTPSPFLPPTPGP